MTTTEGFTIRIDWQGGACPYQAEGVLIINEMEYLFYFRFRGDRASIAIYQDGHEEVYEDCLFRREQRNVTGINANGYMEDAEAEILIRRWAGDFVNEHTWYCDECHEVACIFGIPDQPECVCPRCDGVFCRNHLYRHTISSGECHD